MDAGEFSTELRFGFSKDHASDRKDRHIRMRQHVDYGLTDWYALRVVVAQGKQKYRDFQHQAITVENRFQLIEKKDHGWDAGIRFNYMHSDGDKTPNRFDVMMTAQMPLYEGWEFRQNAIFEYEVGPDARDGLVAELRSQVNKKIEAFDSKLSSFHLGIEMFNRFGRLTELSGYGDQAHQIGPMARGRLTEGVFFQTGYRAGISNESDDHLIHFSVGKVF